MGLQSPPCKGSTASRRCLKGLARARSNQKVPLADTVPAVSGHDLQPAAACREDSWVPRAGTVPSTPGRHSTSGVPPSIRGFYKSEIQPGDDFLKSSIGEGVCFPLSHLAHEACVLFGKI